jgi:hypothetical protein
MPVRLSATMMRRIRSAFAASAACAVEPSLSTPKEKTASSGLTRAVPLPLTVTVRGLGSAEPWAAPGRPTPASAKIAAASAASAAIEAILICPPRLRTRQVRRR